MVPRAWRGDNGVQSDAADAMEVTAATISSSNDAGTRTEMRWHRRASAEDGCVERLREKNPEAAQGVRTDKRKETDQNGEAGVSYLGRKMEETAAETRTPASKIGSRGARCGGA